MNKTKSNKKNKGGLFKKRKSKKKRILKKRGGATPHLPHAAAVQLHGELQSGYESDEAATEFDEIVAEFITKTDQNVRNMIKILHKYGLEINSSKQLIQRINRQALERHENVLDVIRSQVIQPMDKLQSEIVKDRMSMENRISTMTEEIDDIYRYLNILRDRLGYDPSPLMPPARSVAKIAEMATPKN